MTEAQIPAHSHALVANADPGATLVAQPDGNALAAPSGLDLYRSATPTAAMSGDMIRPSGASLPHSNLQPYLCVNFIISLFGIFPSPT